MSASSLDGGKSISLEIFFEPLLEITGGIRRVTLDAEFMGLLARQTPETKKQKQLDVELKALKDQPDAIGAHVQEQIIRQTLNNLDGSLFGFFEIGMTIAAFLI
jgi:hypothetical protein